MQRFLRDPDCPNEVAGHKPGVIIIDYHDFQNDWYTGEQPAATNLGMLALKP